MEIVHEKSKSASFTYSFTTAKSLGEVYELLLDVKKWWSGFYEETITGRTVRINDEFSFLAGNGVHFSRQKLVELVPQSRTVWKVLESKLTFLEAPDEWRDSKICFDIAVKGEKTKVTFTHEGLESHMECFENCPSAWNLVFGKTQPDVKRERSISNL